MPSTLQAPGGEERGWACTPALLYSCLAEAAAYQGSLGWWRKSDPNLLPVPRNFGRWGKRVMGTGHQQCQWEALKPRGAAEGSHYGHNPLQSNAFVRLAAGCKPPSGQLSGKEVWGSSEVIFLWLEHSWGKQVLSGLPTLFLSVKCSCAKLIISVGWESLKGTFLSSA